MVKDSVYIYTTNFRVYIQYYFS